MSDDTIPACPACDSVSIGVVSSSRYGTDTPAWKCEDCGERFDDPKKRPPKSREKTVTHGLAKRLAEMDADEVGDDNGALYGTGTRSQRQQYAGDD